MRLRVIFMGTPLFAVPALDALAAAHDVIAVYTQPPRPGGRRGRELTPSPVQRRAQDFGIAVRHPLSLKGAAEQTEFAACGADIAVVAAYGLILPQAVLDAPRHGCVNIHASLLPRWRGAAPIQRAILAGDAETGVTIMQMAAGLDTGPVRAEARVPIDFHDTAGKLTAQLADLGAAMLIEVLDDLPGHPLMPQSDAGVEYARKIDKAETRLDFTKGALHAHRQIRAFNPTPGAWFETDGERFKVLQASIPSKSADDLGISFPTLPGEVLDDQLAIGCGDGAIRPAVVQRAGRAPMATLDLLRGFPIPKGTRLA